MHFLAECLLLTFVWALYWLCHDRRRYLRRRVGTQAFKNVYRVGRNVFFMLRRNELEVCGNKNVLSKGCILYSFHFGVWELMPYTLNKLGHKIGIIANRYSAAGSSVQTRIIDYLLRRWRSTNGVRVFYKENLLEIVSFLRSGGVFGVLVDGNTFFQKHDKVRRLAKICRVPLVPFAAYRKGGKGILRIGCDIPTLVRAMPLDYVWFYKSR